MNNDVKISKKNIDVALNNSAIEVNVILKNIQINTNSILFSIYSDKNANLSWAKLRLKIINDYLPVINKEFEQFDEKAYIMMIQPTAIDEGVTVSLYLTKLQKINYQTEKVDSSIIDLLLNENDVSKNNKLLEALLLTLTELQDKDELVSLYGPILPKVKGIHPFLYSLKVDSGYLEVEGQVDSQAYLSKFFPQVEISFAIKSELEKRLSKTNLSLIVNNKTSKFNYYNEVDRTFGLKFKVKRNN